MSLSEDTPYMTRNLKGFEGDTHLRASIQRFIDKFHVKRVIETGTFFGGTTKALAGMVDEVVTIESNQEYYVKAAAFLQGIENIRMILGDSEKELPAILKDPGSVLLFLDAHWYDKCPLLDELQAIADADIWPVIVIHDFVVPGRKDLGFDTYKGQPLNYGYIKDKLAQIYPLGYHYEYNSQANGAKRGVIFIYPVQPKELS